MTRLTMSALIGTALMNTLSASATDLDAQFRQVEVGLTREAVVALMGHPDTEVSATVVLVPYAKLRWNASSERSFLVTLIKNRVVVTKVCVGTGAC